MSDKTTPSETITRKPVDDVGKSGPPPVGHGHQTREQAAITELGTDGRTDADRRRAERQAGGQAGRNPTPIGGSSSGHSDQQSAVHEGRKVAQGHYKVEQER